MVTLPPLWTLKILDQVNSTNSMADDLARQGAPEGTAVLARYQTAGRGRWGRVWESQSDKNLYISVVLRPTVPPQGVASLTLVAGLATSDMLRSDYGAPVQLKWPNDIWWQDKKMGGILTELHMNDHTVGHVVVGLGLNVNGLVSDFSPEVAKIATSLIDCLGKTVSINEMAIHWCRQLYHRLTQWREMGIAGLRNDYDHVMALKGEEVRIEDSAEAIQGVVTGIDATGRLLVQGKDHLHAIDAGEVVKVCCL